MHVNKYCRIRKKSDRDNACSKIVNRLPVKTLLLGLTSRCNLNCTMCLTKNINKSELPFNRIKQILDDASEIGIFDLVFTGGEPVIRKDFAEIYRYAITKGFLVRVLTNLVSWDDSIFTLFQKYHPFQIQVSIYGFSKGTYERVTRVNDSFSIFQKNLFRLRKKRIYTRFTTTLTVDNKEDLTRYKNMPIKNWEFKVITAVLRGRKEPDKSDEIRKQMLSSQEVANILTDFRPSSPEGFTPFPDKLRAKFFGKCSPRNILYIDTEEDCMLCYQVSFPSQRQRYVAGKMREIIADLTVAREEAPDLPEDLKCVHCSALAYCSWCPQYAQEMLGGLKHDQYLCEIYSNRDANIRNY